MKHLRKFNEEKKSEKWISDVIKKPGALRNQMGKKGEEKISKGEIAEEISKLRKKDKDSKKPGIQGLSKKDLTKYKRLNLAKALKSFKESEDVDNYMFFANLENICTMVREILDNMDHDMIDKMLTDEHDWATDHISKSKESISHVYNWLKSEH